MKIPTFNWKPPKSFTDEDTLFSMDSEEYYSWHACKTCALYCAILAIPAIYLQWWWALPILTFVGVMAISFAGTIENKAGSGYPYLEPGDVMGVVFGGAIMFFFCATAFLAIVFGA